MEDPSEVWDDVLVVGRHDAAGAPGGSTLDGFEDPFGPAMVLMPTRFIGQENPRRQDEGTREGRPLLFAYRRLARETVGKSVESKILEEIADEVGRVIQLARETSGVFDVLAHG